MNSELNYIKLADGTLIDPSNGKRIKQVSKEATAIEALQANEAVDFAPTRHYLDELPASPKMLNSVIVVMGYKIFGLSDDDVAHTLNITPEQVSSVVSSDIYQRFFTSILQNVRDHDQDLVRRALNKGALSAAESLVQIMGDEDAKDNDRISAANSILDRTGNRPVDVIEHRHRVEGGLSIRIIEEKQDDLPVIDLTPELIDANRN